MLRIPHLFHERTATTETTMSDEAAGRTPDSVMVGNEQPYDRDERTVRLSITFLPSGGDKGGRSKSSSLKKL